MSAQPNILLVFVDEHAPHFSSVYGNAAVPTPNLEALAARGVTFDAAYCNSPLCVPSRMSFMTGQKVVTCGAWDNGVPLGSDVPTLAHAMRAQGYRTVLSGKMHFIGPDQRHGFEERLVEDWSASDMAEVISWDEGGDVKPGRERVRRAGPVRSKAIEYDERVHRTCMDFLANYPAQRAAGDDRPFFLVAGYFAPHFPLQVPEPYFSRFYPNATPMPDLPQGHIASQPPYIDRLRRYFGVDGLTDEEVRKGRGAYFGLVNFVDDKVGELVAQLEAQGLTGDTIVIYSADHGEMAGEHGLWWKCNFYEQSVRIPMIAVWPGKGARGIRRSEPVDLLDLAATLVDLGGEGKPAGGSGAAAARVAAYTEGLEGLSLRPALEHDRPVSALSGRGVISEYYAHGIGTPVRMLRKGTWKYIHVHGESEELYDLAADPKEFRNLAGDAAHAKTLAALRDETLRGWDGAAVDAEVRRSQRQRMLINALEGGERREMRAEMSDVKK